jgi:hypothetical protein
MTLAPAQLSVFGEPLLLEGENAASYDELFARICAAVKPMDGVEEMFIVDVVQLEWEILRWRRLKLGFIRDRTDPVSASSLAEQLDYIEQIDRLTTIAENRRNSALREIDRHRAVLGESLRRSVHEIEDGEFEVIEPTPAIGKDAA